MQDLNKNFYKIKSERHEIAIVLMIVAFAAVLGIAITMLLLQKERFEKKQAEQSAYIEYLENKYEELLVEDSPFSVAGRSMCGIYDAIVDSDGVYTMLDCAGSLHPEIDEYFARKLTNNYKSLAFLKTNDCFPNLHEREYYCFASFDNGVRVYDNYVLSLCEHVLFMQEVFSDEEPDEETYIKKLEELTNIKYKLN